MKKCKKGRKNHKWCLFPTGFKICDFCLNDAVLVAWELCRSFWRAGISQKTLQFLPCSGGQEGRQLVNHAGVNAVILTGGTETALQMLADKPSMSLTAETGGKNATIVTAMADRDQAIKHVIHSAFSHAGPEMLGHLAAVAGGRGLRRREVQARPVRRDPEHDRRLGLGTEDQDRSAHPSARRRPG